MVNSILVVVGLLHLIDVIDGHGRLVDPPSRASMWRYGYTNPKDYDDTAGWCGGFAHFIAQGRRCGICGDPYDQSRPRAHETGGLYGNDVIVRKYEKGEIFGVTVQLTANHRGFFEFKVCPVKPKREATEVCLNKYKLKLAVGGGTRYVVPTFKPDTYNIKLKLPSDLTCTQCTFQWTYTAGNNWGNCPDGKGALGCGPQETFRACADISIS